MVTDVGVVPGIGHRTARSFAATLLRTCGYTTFWRAASRLPPLHLTLLVHYAASSSGRTTLAISSANASILTVLVERATLSARLGL